LKTVEGVQTQKSIKGHNSGTFWQGLAQTM